jgi:uncharacterized membrane protein YedE/YeeE
MLSGLISRKVTNASAIAGFLVGLGVGLALYFTLGEEVRLFGMAFQRENVLTVCTVLATSITLVAVMLAAPMQAREQARIEPFHQRLETPIGGLEEDHPALVKDGGGPSPFRIVGTVLILTSVMLIGVQPWVKPVEGVITKGNLPLALNMGIGLALLVLGAIMVWQTRRKSA